MSVSSSSCVYVSIIIIFILRVLIHHDLYIVSCTCSWRPTRLKPSFCFSCPVSRRVVFVRRPGLYGLSQEGLCGNGLVLSISATRLAFGRGGGTVCIGSLTRLECSDLQKIVRRSRSDATSSLGGSKRCNQQAQRSNHQQQAST